MRVDLFLKKCGLVKHRPFAKLACDKGRILVDGVKAKPGKEVRAGSKVTMNLTDRTLEIEVLAIPQGNVPKTQAEQYYRVLRAQVEGVQDF